MKNLKVLSLILIAVMLFQACGSSKTSVYWVDAYRADCSGVGKMQCLKVYKGNDLDKAQWELIYSPIEGFKFEEGFFKKIEVKEEKLNPKDVPADAPSVRYTLVRELEKVSDFKTQLEGQWLLEAVNSKKLGDDSMFPMNIDPFQNKVNGSDGCNHYMGGFSKLNSREMVFSPLATTFRLCEDMQVPDAFSQAISQVATYKVDEHTLYMYNKQGKEVLRFGKVTR